MGDLWYPNRNTPEVTFNEEKAAKETWGALLAAGAFVQGDFEFASGTRATLKVDAERLYSHPEQLEVIIGHFAIHPCVIDADVLLYVPEGMREFVRILGNKLEKTVVKTERISDGSRYNFEFTTKEDARIANKARDLVICEDVVSTLGSVAGIARLLSTRQKVSSLAIINREGGIVNPYYREKVKDHYLLVRRIPRDYKEFIGQLGEDELAVHMEAVRPKS